MYKVVLVDDEPLVLSGIKSLLDWESLGCEIIHTARNGKQAIEVIEAYNPDIVLCDINMPILSGIDVLKHASDLSHTPVFVILTNHQDFDLARESLRYKAVDYLLKTQLESEVLQATVQKAIEECEKRRSVDKLYLVNQVIKEDISKVIKGCLKKILDYKVESRQVESYRLLEENYVFDCYALLEIVLDFSVLPKVQNTCIEDRERIYGLVYELLETILPKVFKNYLIRHSDNSQQRFQVCIWDLDESLFEEHISLLYSRLVMASANITTTKLSLLVSDILKSSDVLQGMKQIEELLEYYYREQPDRANYSQVQTLVYEDFTIAKEIDHLIIGLRSKNVCESKEALSHIVEKFQDSSHHRKLEIKSCIDLYTAIYTVFVPMLPQPYRDNEYSELSYTLQNVNEMLHYKVVYRWLEELQQQLINHLMQITGTNSEVIEKVKAYIWAHSGEKIMLQEIADYVNMSPTYLSALFKKQCNQTLVDYINEAKMNKACELIQEGKHKICEISYLLSFENAYYFTKVFKKYIGKTPKEYQNQVRGR